ncbi:NADH-ubiquinone oxidoreductase-F iron-sulfur binding region domain-containing protein [Phosphitispora sp. TUW77]|uniref:NADH-ubiquinone oxidoreductase-F iron-sulfur binding region domain-containing protein n=1 Tax=Phosphitispora sp. TUW77 TaxID=3152361 RepID=UPI003AB6BE3A
MTVSESKYQELKNRASEKASSLQEKAYVMIGTATCGRAAGALKILGTFKEEVQKHQVEVEIIEAGCLGHCYAEPMVIVYKPGFPALCYANIDEGIASRLVSDFLVGDDPCFEFAMAALEPNDFFPTFADYPRGVYEQKIILEACGLIDPEDIDHYIAREGYGALMKILAAEPPEVIAEIKDSQLRGRGGAGFPTGKKWEICRDADADVKYVICNADEGDPGAFMDRALLESNPHQVIEGMIIAAYAVGASQGYIYVRAEYPLAIARLRTALQQARVNGLLGDSILGSGFSFDIRIFQGSGAFVCGEETALIASIEGKPGIPSHRPPFPAVLGLRGKPTLIDNVKTLSYVPHIIRNGAGWFKGIGTPDSPGTAVFALAGKVAGTGLVEVPMGISLRTLIYDVGNGIKNEKAFKAIQIGGPSGGCLPESALDLTIDFDSLQHEGAMMGSGGLVVLDEDDCMVEIARFFLEFTQNESCGKCTFCRLGTKQMLEILTDITKGIGKPEDLELLWELAEDIKTGSLCGLGKTAPNPVLSTLRFFRDEYEAHIQEGRCPAHKCKELVSYRIAPRKCSKLCDACIASCPVEAVYTRADMLKEIDLEKCVKCDNCLVTCLPLYDAVEKVSPPITVAVEGGEAGE